MIFLISDSHKYINRDPKVQSIKVWHSKSYIKTTFIEKISGRYKTPVRFFNFAGSLERAIRSKMGAGTGKWEDLKDGTTT